TTDICIISYSQAGQLNWAKSIGGTADDIGSCIFAASNQILIGGSFKSSCDFDPSAGMDPQVSNGGTDAFLMSLDLLGNYQWTGAFGDNDNDFINAVGADGSGRIYATGVFEGTVDFDPGVGSEVAMSVGLRDAFVWVLDAAGNFVAVNLIAGSGLDSGEDIAVDAVGHVYLIGNFQNTMDADPGAAVVNLSAQGPSDCFVLKLNPNGTLSWAYQIGGNDYDDGGCIELGSDGMLYTSIFYFEATVDADPGSGVLNFTSNGNYDFLISKTDTSSVLAWAFSIGGAWNDLAYGLTLNAQNDVVVSGNYVTLVDFNPGPTTNNLNTPSLINGDGFVAKYTQQPTAILDEPVFINDVVISPNPSMG
ncbi:MAG: hypothetical protein ACRCYO_10965, partial [Bacteroidia bacterium]